MPILKNITKVIFVIVLNLLFLSPLFAQEIIEVKPNINITNGYIDKRDYVITVDYGYEIGESINKSIKLFEDDIEILSTFNIVDTKILITKNTYYHSLKTYRLEILNIESLGENTIFNDVNTTFKYASLKSFEIGKTVKGRSIKAYSLGEGSQVFLLLGAIHGNEKNTSKLVSQMLTNFMRNPEWVPDDSKIIFVPTVNVDGYVRNGRYNLNGVDLNRNSKTKDWQSLTYWGILRVKNGGGINPNTEPELRAIQRLVKIYKPFLTISYHSAGNYVITNGPNAREYARTYSKLSRYKYVDQSSGDKGFSYKITGDFTNWMYDRGYNALTVELKSRKYTEVPQNLNGLKEILKNY